MQVSGQYFFRNNMRERDRINMIIHELIQFNGRNMNQYVKNDPQEDLSLTTNRDHNYYHRLVIS